VPDVVVASDLDRTLIYSRAAIDAFGDGGVAVTPVERYRNADASFMSIDAADAFAELHRSALVLPVTTRTPEQWRRIQLPGPPPRYAVTANGGVLLVDGVADEAWRHRVEATLTAAAPLGDVWEHVEQVCDPVWTTSMRRACELFCYAVLRRELLPDGVVEAETAWARERGWHVSLQGRKLYWVPQPLTKSAAVAEVARRVGGRTVLAAGDSLLDADLLEAADAGIAARHGELVASGWRAPHVGVTEAQGVRAGAEIVTWLGAEAVRADRYRRASRTARP
jgi:hypothetical protein